VILSLALVGGFATQAHAGWFRVLGPNQPRKTQDEDLIQRQKTEAKPARTNKNERALRANRVHEEALRRASVPHFTPLVGSRSAAPVHALAGKFFGSEQHISIAERLGGSIGHHLAGESTERIIKHNSNLFLKPQQTFTFWRNSWRGAGDEHQHLFAFNR
jgi:hypothetical protein